MTEMFGEAWPPMSVPDLAPDDDDDLRIRKESPNNELIRRGEEEGIGRP